MSWPGLVSIRKDFFFEKKKQKTFFAWLWNQKFFGSFFQERTASL
jgi:hypothetical protein